MTVQGPVKKQQPDGLSHKGARFTLGRPPLHPQTPPTATSHGGGGACAEAAECFSEGPNVVQNLATGLLSKNVMRPIKLISGRC